MSRNNIILTDNIKITSFRPSIYGILLNNKKLLMIEGETMYNLPGGGIESGEAPLDALRREFIEETGFTIEPIEVLCSTKGFYRNWHKPDQQLLGSWWRVKWVDGELKEAGDKKWKERPFWVSTDTIPTSNMSQFNQECLPYVMDYISKNT